VDYTTEEDRIAAQREKEIAKITELKKATHEKTKTWSDTMKVRYKVTSITRRRKINRYFRCAL
jgi:ABC-type polysaccharide/polyol phosphate transport system ATPase subunit